MGRGLNFLVLRAFTQTEKFKRLTVLQHVLSMDPFKLGYTEDGHCCGEPHPNLPGPQRLQWEIPAEVRLLVLLSYWRTISEILTFTGFGFPLLVA